MGELTRIWRRIPGLWKGLSLLVAILAVGWSVHAYAGRFVTRDELDARESGMKALAAQIAGLREDGARRDAQLRAIEDDAKAAREDVRVLLTRMLAAPPPAGRTP